jgi:hypothetical protein
MDCADGDAGSKIDRFCPIDPLAINDNAVPIAVTPTPGGPSTS